MILKIERLKPKLGDFGWEQIPDIKIKEENDKKNSILWKGNVEVPPKQSDSDKLRLVIKEYETFMTESSNYTEYLNEETTILMRLDIDVNGKKMHEVGRLVYFDTIDLG